MAYNKEHKKVPDGILEFVEAETSVTMMFWLVIFLVVAIVKIIG